MENDNQSMYIHTIGQLYMSVFDSTFFCIV